MEVSDGVSPGGGDDVLFVLSLKEDNIYRVDVVFGLGGHLCAHIALHEVDGAEVQFYFAVARLTFIIIVFIASAEENRQQGKERDAQLMY